MLTGEALLPLPAVLVFFVFIGSICCLSLLEGTQVAILVEVNKDPEPYKVSHPRAYALMKRVTHEKNVRRFLIGRQFLVIFVVFLINQCTIFPDIQHFGIPFGVWYFFVSLGFPTAINCLCFGQLPCELLANQDPYMFMNRYGPRTVVEICLFMEMTGVAHFSWVVTALSLKTWYRGYSRSVMTEQSKFQAMESVPTDATCSESVAERT